jgi:hypothetical protein
MSKYFYIGCTDIDDALHARQLSNGNYEIGVREYFVVFHFFRFQYYF